MHNKIAQQMVYFIYNQSKNEEVKKKILRFHTWPTEPLQLVRKQRYGHSTMERAETNNWAYCTFFKAKDVLPLFTEWQKKKKQNHTRLGSVCKTLESQFD